MNRAILPVLVLWSSFAHGADDQSRFRVCVEKARLAPVKASGQAWDPGGRSVSSKEAEEAIASAVAGVDPVAIAGKLMLAATAAPDPLVRVWVGDKVALTTDLVHDTYSPSWNPGPSSCAALTRTELQDIVRVEVVDMDADNPDAVAKAILPKGVPESVFDSGVLNIGPTDALVSIELTVLPQKVDAGPGFQTLKKSVVIPSGKTSGVEFEINAVPGTLKATWTSLGSKVNLPGATDDTLIGCTLFGPDGRRVFEVGKHQRGDQRIEVRDAGKYRLEFSNVGILRSSARRVTYKIEFDSAEGQ